MGWPPGPRVWGAPDVHRRCGTNTNEQSGDAVSLVYQCRLPLSSKTVNYVADLLRKHLKAIGSRWRSLPTGRIVVLVLAVLRHDRRAADLAGGRRVLTKLRVSPARATNLLRALLVLTNLEANR